MSPVAISYDQAIVIALVGLAVNLGSAWLLRDAPERGHAHPHDDSDRHQSHHHDHNLRAAYLHVLADALTSVLTVAALTAGLVYGWSWMDPIMGIVGALVIAHWSVGLLRSSGAVLLDATPDASLATRVKKRLEVGSDRWPICISGGSGLAMLALSPLSCLTRRRRPRHTRLGLPASIFSRM
jgi:cation diffusion facilitator family transporter